MCLFDIFRQHSHKHDRIAYTLLLRVLNLQTMLYRRLVSGLVNCQNCVALRSEYTAQYQTRQFTLKQMSQVKPTKQFGFKQPYCVSVVLPPFCEHYVMAPNTNLMSKAPIKVFIFRALVLIQPILSTLKEYSRRKSRMICVAKHKQAPRLSQQSMADKAISWRCTNLSLVQIPVFLFDVADDQLGDAEFRTFGSDHGRMTVTDRRHDQSNTMI